MARPKKIQRRNQRILVHLHDEEFQDIKDYAELTSLSMAAIMRNCFLEKRRGIQREIAKLREQQEGCKKG